MSMKWMNKPLTRLAKSKPKKPKVVEVKPPPPIPVQDVQVTDKSGKSAEAIRRQRGGVASTALSDRLGG
jgi:hypothetical protein